MSALRRNPFFREYDIRFVKHWIDQAPEYELKPVVVEGQVQKRFKAVVNKHTGYVVAIVSNKFQLIQHSTVFNTFLEALEQKYDEKDITGFFRWTDTRAFLTTYFENWDFKENDNYRLGLLVTNGVDGSMAVWCKFAGLRLVCSNGLVETKTIKVVKTVHIGVDPEEFMERMINRFETIIDSVYDYRRVLDNKLISLQSKEITKDKALEIVRKLELPQKAIAVVNWKLPSEKITLYDLYNAITEYLSNYSNLRIDNRIQELARIDKALLSLSSS